MRHARAERRQIFVLRAGPHVADYAAALRAARNPRCRRVAFWASSSAIRRCAAPMRHSRRRPPLGQPPRVCRPVQGRATLELRKPGDSLEARRILRGGLPWRLQERSRAARPNVGPPGASIPKPGFLRLSSSSVCTCHQTPRNDRGRAAAVRRELGSLHARRTGLRFQGCAQPSESTGFTPSRRWSSNIGTGQRRGDAIWSRIAKHLSEGICRRRADGRPQVAGCRCGPKSSSRSIEPVELRASRPRA